eukprot:scaffold9245_cov78-Phaeocystis_antarctica.AAC.3
MPHHARSSNHTVNHSYGLSLSSAARACRSVEGAVRACSSILRLASAVLDGVALVPTSHFRMIFCSLRS